MRKFEVGYGFGEFKICELNVYNIYCKIMFLWMEIIFRSYMYGRWFWNLIEIVVCLYSGIF